MTDQFAHLNEQELRDLLNEIVPILDELPEPTGFSSNARWKFLHFLIAEAKEAPDDEAPGIFEPEIDAYKYKSSDGTYKYFLTHNNADGALTCNCKGFQFRGICRHVREFAEDRGMPVPAPVIRGS